MTPARYVTGDATRPEGTGTKIIAHVVNDRGGFGKGFALALAKRWPAVRAGYRWWYEAGADAGFELGQTQVIRAADGVFVVNMLAQHGYTAARSGPAIRYDALAECLEHLAKVPLGILGNDGIHMPRIGCGLAGGTWDRVEPLITSALCARDIQVTVYDLPTRKR